MSDQVSLLRILEYRGAREDVEEIVSRSIHGTRVVGRAEHQISVSAASIGDFPEILEKEGREE